MITGIDPKVDYVFKKLFASEANVPILLDLLNAVLSPPSDKRLVTLELINPFNDKEFGNDKLSVVDIKARDQSGRYYTIEMQNYASPAYLDRVLYYWAKLLTRQLTEGDEYQTLQPTISISFVDTVLFPEVTDYHLDFRLASARHPDLRFSELQSIHVVELPKFLRGPDELASPLEAWCYFLKNAAMMETDQLPSVMARPAMKRAMEVLAVISQTELDRERYEDAVRAARDRRSDIRFAKEEGLKEGHVGRIHLCQRLLKTPPTPREQLMACTMEELEAQAKAIEMQLESVR